MKERQILFKGPMVRAILGGRKTQTRRLNGLQKINEEPNKYASAIFLKDGSWSFRDLNRNPIGWVDKCPYGQPGDRLWVRETCHYCNGSMDWIYAADEKDFKERVGCMNPEKLRWHPSIHMPRWASRITLEITDVRVERLQEISEEDAKAEGCESYVGESDWSDFSYRENYTTAKDDFKELWDSINAKKYPWGSNPWVWCLSFRRINNAAV